MFGKKKEVCCICNQNVGDKKISEGLICKDCISKCGQFLITLNWKGISSERVRQAISANETNAKNLDVFKATRKCEKYFELDEVYPCEICLRLIKNAGIDKVVTNRGIIYERQLDGILRRN